MAQILQKVKKILFSSFEQTALLPGTSDIMAVKWDSGQILSTPFVVCFGHNASTSLHKNINIYVNKTLINKIQFTLDKYGYLQPMTLKPQQISKLNLIYGRNSIKFELDHQTSIQSQIYLYSEHDKLLVSDMDGTLTKNDLGGLYSNFYDREYLHDGYHDLIQTAYKNGYKVIWLTMRSLPLYAFSKDYIRKHTKIDGALMTEPQEFFPAIKKELLKQTGNIKTNMMLSIRNLFPKQNNPFIGGLGNRENDAIAYRAAGIPMENIFIVDTESKVHHLGNSKYCTSYAQMKKSIQEYFPKIQAKSLLTYAMSIRGKDKENKSNIKVNKKGKNILGEIFLGNIGNTV